MVVEVKCVICPARYVRTGWGTSKGELNKILRLTLSIQLDPHRIWEGLGNYWHYWETIQEEHRETLSLCITKVRSMLEQDRFQKFGCGSSGGVENKVVHVWCNCLPTTRRAKVNLMVLVTKDMVRELFGAGPISPTNCGN
ncbi:hypothetical protein BT69DRAFT_1292913 [Atractiella rhizophila]|nr:hypothetical protein BT69DRAFT_1292913 [Atractiella rhizophila]